MFLLPLIQDIEVWHEERQINKDIKDYIYLEKNGEILKFKVSVPHLEITNCLEYYLDNLPMKKFNIVKENYVKAFRWPLNLVKSIGKFKLQDEYFKTKNYLVPPTTTLSNFLCEKHRKNGADVTFSSQNLSILNEISEKYLDEERYFELGIIKNLISKFEIELVEKYNLNLEQIEMYIKNIESLLGNDESKTILSKLRWILTSSKKNKSYIEELGIEDKFVDAINKDKQNQKVK